VVTTSSYLANIVILLTFHHSTGDYGGLSIPSGGIQAFFEESGSDSLLIYDACHSAETAISIDSHFPRSVTELIAACGFQTFAPGVGEHSLTHTLAKELRHLRTGDRPFSVLELFSRVLTRLKYTPSREDRTTLVHTTLTWEASGRCIMLEPLIHNPIPREHPPDTMPLALFLDTQGELNTEEYEKWISNAPPSISNVYFKHPLLDKICVDGASRARTFPAKPGATRTFEKQCSLEANGARAENQAGEDLVDWKL
jgi:hypothetical protein